MAVRHRHVMTEALHLAAQRPCEARLVGIIQEIDEEIGFPTAKAIACPPRAGVPGQVRGGTSVQADVNGKTVAMPGR
ncbi:hypothetical protein AVW15_13315 [Chelatococcus daeguensis]|nr:hypothetical protein AVW15_13315 [Chelatococcus daeguensis]